MHDSSVRDDFEADDHLAISAPDLSLEPRVPDLQRYLGRLSGRLAQTPRRGRARRLNRDARLGCHRSIIVKAGITGPRAFDDFAAKYI